MAMKTKTLDRPLEIKAEDVAADGTFEGYGSVFGNIDSYRDIVEAGAFDESLKKHASKGTLPAMLWQHRWTEPIGVYTSMKEDARGLYVKGQLNLEVEKGREAHALLKQGALRGLSIGYRVLESDYDKDKNVYFLKELDLMEVSLVTFPANDEANVMGVKDAPEFKSLAEIEAFLREECDLPRKTATDVVSAVKRVENERREGAKLKREFMASLNRLAETTNT